MDCQCRLVDTGSSAYRAAVELRRAVLREPLGLEFSADELYAERDCYHLVGECSGQLLACLVLAPLTAQRWRLRQMVVVEDRRGQGIGGQLVEYAEQVARQAGCREILLHARVVSEGFYQRLGYHPEGELFDQVGLPHRCMRKVL